MLTKLLAALPFIGILIGAEWVNRTTPLILGLPPMLAWIVFWIVASSALMGLIYWLDRANRRDGGSAR